MFHALNVFFRKKLILCRLRTSISIMSGWVVESISSFDVVEWLVPDLSICFIVFEGLPPVISPTEEVSFTLAMKYEHTACQLHQLLQRNPECSIGTNVRLVPITGHSHDMQMNPFAPLMRQGRVSVIPILIPYLRTSQTPPARFALSSVTVKIKHLTILKQKERKTRKIQVRNNHLTK